MLPPIFVKELDVSKVRTTNGRRKQGGMALAELALAVGLTSMIMMAMSPLIVRSMDARKARSVAEDYTAFRAAASAHFQSNRSAYDAAMSAGTDADKLCKVGVNADGTGGTVVNSTTMHRCVIDASMLRYLKALPAGVSTTNRYGETWVAIFKQIYDSAPTPAPTGGVEMYVVSARVDGTAPAVEPDPRAHDEAITASGFVGGQGGIIPDADRSTCVASRTAAKFEACGSGWKANLADFLEPSEVTAFASRLSN